jgi:hypothetical protein
MRYAFVAGMRRELVTVICAALAATVGHLALHFYNKPRTLGKGSSAHANPDAGVCRSAGPSWNAKREVARHSQLDLVRYLNICMRWNRRRIWVSLTASDRLLGQIIRVVPAQLSSTDVDLTVLLQEGAVINLRASEKGRLWDFS